jgi:glycosyltransferase involved in cell wall biosynthesis
MRILQVAPLFERVPPVTYGGTERVVSYLTEALIELGHQVTLIASGDSITKATLIPGSPRSLRLDESKPDTLLHHVRELGIVERHAEQFDVVHFHTGLLQMPLARRLRVPSVTTLHGRLDLPDIRVALREFSDLPFVSISNAQRPPIPSLRWAATVYHGLPENLLPFRSEPEKYLAFVGRISPEKRADRAIEIATKAGIELRIAAKVDAADEEYFEREIKPLLSHPGVTYLGEINEQQKAALLGGARALLFPIDWPEPFGMVVIEAMSCGTPILAWNHGSVPELIDEGVNGWIVDSVDRAVDVLKNARIDRRAVRGVFEERFTARRMARDYVRVYEALRNVRGQGLLEALGA